jgi:hypothetical protein
MQFILFDPTQQTLYQAAALLAGGLIGLLFLGPKGHMDRAPFFAMASAIWLLFDLSTTAALSQLARSVPIYSSGLASSPLLVLAPALIAGLALGSLAAARARAIFGQTRFALLAFVPLVGFLFFVFAKTRSTGPQGSMTLPVYLTGSHGVQLGVAFALSRWVFNVIIENHAQVSPYSM